MAAADGWIDEGDFRDTLSRQRCAVRLANEIAPFLRKKGRWPRRRPDSAQRVLNEELDDVILGVDASRGNDIGADYFEALLDPDPVEDPILLLRIPVLIRPSQGIGGGKNFVGRCGLTFRGNPAGKQLDASPERRNRGPKRDFGRVRAKHQGQFSRATLEFVEQSRKQTLVLARAPGRILACEPVVLERSAAVRLFLNNNLVDKPARFHASKGEQAIDPRISAVPNKFQKGLFTPFAGLDPACDQCVDHAARRGVLRRQLQFTCRNGAIRTNADGRETALQIAGAPLALRVVLTLKLVPQL